jgi:WD40 repeat protein
MAVIKFGWKSVKILRQHQHDIVTRRPKFRVLVTVALLIFLIFATAAVLAQTETPPEIYVIALDWSSDSSVIAFGTGQILPPWPDNNLIIEAIAGIMDLENNIIFSVGYSWSLQNVELNMTDEQLLTFSGLPQVWDVNTGQTAFNELFEGIFYNDATWSPVSDALLLTGVRTIYVHDSPFTFELIGAFIYRSLPPESFAEDGFMVKSIWSPDGFRAATSTTFGSIYVWDTSAIEGNFLTAFTGHTTAVQHMVWNPATGLIASGDTSGNIFIWDPDSGDEVTQLSGHTDALLDIDWRPNGEQVVSTSLDGTIRVWEWPSGESRIVQSGEIVSAVAYSPDGTKLAYGGLVASGSTPEIKIINAPTPEPSPTVTFTSTDMP